MLKLRVKESFKEKIKEIFFTSFTILVMYCTVLSFGGLLIQIMPFPENKVSLHDQFFFGFGFIFLLIIIVLIVWCIKEIIKRTFNTIFERIEQ